MVRDPAVEDLPTIQELRSIGLYCGVTGDLLGQPILADLPGVRIYV